MPPALSDEENGASSADEEIPYRSKGKGKTEDPEPEEGEEEEEGEPAEDEYAVEKILSHRTADNTIEYRVKWVGFESKKDLTWEPEDNLEGAREILREYWDVIGGRPEPGQPSKKRKGRKSAAAESESGTPFTTKRVRQEEDWAPPLGSWELDVDHVETVEENYDAQTGKPARLAYLVWNNQKKTQHPLIQIYNKCPQKMLQYYESHLVFTHPGDDDINGGKDLLMKDEFSD